MPGPMSRPDGVRETPEQRKKRGQDIMRNRPVKTGKTKSS